MRLRLMMQDGEFAKYWIGQTFSVFGSNVAAFALPLTAVYFLEASPFQVGLLQSMSDLPFLLFALPVGVWVDRIEGDPVHRGRGNHADGGLDAAVPDSHGVRPPAGERVFHFRMRNRRGGMAMTLAFPRLFRGFTPEALQFLRDVHENNSKEWFERHRSVYERALPEPMRALASDLSGQMLEIDPLLETWPAVNRTISRIHRDTRFSKDKSLYRDCMWFTFKRPSREWQDAPGFFFELRPESYRYGMGFYSAGKETMDRLRAWIDEEPEEFRRSVAFYERQRTFVIEGECYKKLYAGSKPESILKWYARKNLYLVCNRRIDDLLFSPDLVSELAAGFDMLSGLYHALWRLKERQ